MSKKVSLFAQKMNLPKQPVSDVRPLIQEIREKDLKELESLETSLQTIQKFIHHPKIEVSEVPVETNQGSQDVQIHEENMKKILSMTPEEVQENLKEIEGSLSQSTLDFLRRRGQKTLNAKKNSSKVASVPRDLEEDQLKALKSSSNKTCMHLDIVTSEFDQIRYDTEGKPVQFFIKGVWQGSCQGFTLRELSNLLRSSIPSQRVLSLDTLFILFNDDIEPKTRFLQEECELGRTLVFLCSDKNINVKTRTFSLLAKVLNSNLEKNWKIQRLNDFLFPAVESKENCFLSREIREKTSIWEEEEVRNLTFTDPEAGKDLVVDLVKFGALQVLENFSIDEISEVLLSLALHSVSACFEIVRHSIFWKLINGIPRTYKVLTVLAMSSLPAAHKISRNIPARFFNDLLGVDESINLLYALFAHKQVFDVRVIAFQKCEEGCSSMFAAVTRLVQSFKTGEYVGVVELGFFKFLSQWELFSQKLIANIVELIQISFNQGFFGSLNRATVRHFVIEIVKNTEILTEELKIVNIDGKIIANRIEKGFLTEELEETLLPSVLLLKNCLNFLMQDENSEDFQEIKAKVLESYSNIIKLLKRTLKSLKTETRVPKILCYRLREMIQLLLIFYKFLHLFCPEDLILASFFFSTYDEVIFLDTLKTLFSEPPDFFKGFLNSEKNFLSSSSFHEKSTKIASYFVGLDENPYFPLPFDWLFSPLPTCRETEAGQLLTFISSVQSLLFEHPLSGTIADLNMFILRKDLDYSRYTQALDLILNRLARSSFFSVAVNASKNSVLNLTKDYIANSYLEPVYTFWIVCFLKDDVDQDIFKDVVEELEPLLSRMAPVISEVLRVQNSNHKKLLRLLNQ